MQDLNPRQREAVRYLDGPSLVLAGAGSGKTRVITAKIAHLIQHANLTPRHIYAVTFTNKTAREMKTRISKLLVGGEARGLNVSTFHTLGLHMLRREHQAAGLRNGFTIFDEQDVEQLLKELSKKNDIDKEALQQARWRISQWKNNLINPQTAIQQAEDDREAFHGALYQAYSNALHAYNTVDFDDLILRPVELLKQNPELRERWQNQVRHLLVDEYQDTNGAQYEFVQHLVGTQARFTVVGDDDQSIYAWRGAQPENLARLADDYPHLKLIKLEQNYRSTGHILNAANQLIANNPHVFEKKLWCELGLGDPLKVIACRDEEDEAERVISELIQSRFRSRHDYRDYAVLYRSNHQARPFEKALRVHNIPYFVSGGVAFFSRTEVKDIMSYLRLITNTDDDAALLRVINTPRREIGPSALEKLAHYAASRDKPLFDVLDEFGLEQTLTGKPLKRLREFHAWLIDMQRLAEHALPSEVIDRLLNDIQYQEWLEQSSTNEKAAKRRWSNVNDLVEWLTHLQTEEQKGESLSDIVSHLALMDILERQDDEQNNDRVTLMTLHAAKGLEFPHVFLTGVEEGLLPHQNSIDEENIEEERRLAYVGLTRAQRQLTISYAEKRRRGGEKVTCEPSRFLHELPQDILQWEGRHIETTREEQLQRGKEKLAGLRAMLADTE